jgi:hypothetical protein
VHGVVHATLVVKYLLDRLNSIETTRKRVTGRTYLCHKVAADHIANL